MKHKLNFFSRLIPLLALLFMLPTAMWGEEEILFSTGFESSDGFSTNTTYNNTEEKEIGNSTNTKKWKVLYGTVSTNDKIAGSNSMQMRIYTGQTVAPYAYTNFSVAKTDYQITKIMVDARTNGAVDYVKKFKIQYSLDNGSSWIDGLEHTFANQTTAETDITYTPSSPITANDVRIRFLLSDFTAPPKDNKNKNTNKNFLIDNVRVYGEPTGKKFDVKFYVDGEEQTRLAQKVKEGSNPSTVADPSKIGYTFDGWYSDDQYENKVADITAVVITDNTNFYGRFECATPVISTNLSTDEVVYIQRAEATPLQVASSSTFSLAYQWQSSADNSNWGDITDENDASYTPATAMTGTTYYRCVITNAVDECSANVTSAAAKITVNEEACSSYSFHYGTDGAEPSDWNRMCFVGEGDDRYIEDFEIPAVPNYYVAWQGNWNDGYSHVDAFATNLVFTKSLKSNDDAGTVAGAGEGALGTPHINNTWGCCNKRISFDPAGYSFVYGEDGEGHIWNAMAMTGEGNVTWMSEDVTLTEAMLNGTIHYYIGIKANNDLGCVWTSNSLDVAMNSMGIFHNGAWEEDKTIGGTYAVGDKGKIRIWSDDFDGKNWKAHFVPYWTLRFSANGKEGVTLPEMKEAFSEASEDDRTFDLTDVVPTNIPAHFTFDGWYTQAEGGTKIESTYTLNAHTTLYAHWVEDTKYTVTIETPANGTLTVKNGENVVNNGDAFYAGTALTIACAADPGYKYRNWQYKVDGGSWTTKTTNFDYTIGEKNVSFRANFEMAATSAVTLDNTNCYIVAKVDGTPISGEATEDKTVTLSGTPSAGYVLKGWNVYKTDDATTKVTVSNNSFTMPAYPVTVEAVLIQMTQISAATTWDWENAANKDISLTSETSPKKNEITLLSEISDVNNDANFNSGALIVVAEHIRKAANNTIFMQGNEVYFYTTVPGRVKVTFSNTSNRTDTEANRRFAYINGTNTNSYSLNYDPVTTDAVAVSAGLVTITAKTGEGNGTTIRIMKIEFQTQYTVNYYVNGVKTTETLWTGDALNFPNVADQYGKSFVGWKKGSAIDGVVEEFDDFADTDVKASESTDYYAVFATKTVSDKIEEKIIRLDFVGDAWGIPVGSSNKTTVEQSFTYGGYTIMLGGGGSGNGYYLGTSYNEPVVLMLGKIGAYLKLPELSTPIKKVTCLKTPNASVSGSVTWNVFAGNEAASTAVTGCANGATFNINSNYQNSSLMIKVTNSNNTQFTGVEILTEGPTISYSAYCTDFGQLSFAAKDDKNIYWATFSEKRHVVLDEMIEYEDENLAQITAYIVKADADVSKLNITRLNDNLVDYVWHFPADNGYLLKCEYTGTGRPSMYYYCTQTTSYTVPENNLYPASKAKDELANHKYYKLAYGDNALTPSTLGFYWGEENGGVFESREGSAYLAIPTGSLVSLRGFAFGDLLNPSNPPIVTGIDETLNKYVKSSKALINGKLYIIRDSKVFDLNGRLVK